jgi:hypothetical protein
MSRIEIRGPHAVAPGETAQFTAIARLSDGSTRDLTAEVSWKSENSSVLAFAGGGLATGRTRGESRIAAMFDAWNLPGWKDVIVVPTSTFRLSGQVSEADIPPGPPVYVADARVEVTAGVGAGLLTNTDQHGFYRLYGVAGETGIRVTKDGYQSQALSVHVVDHQQLPIALAPSTPRADRSSTYTLTITAGGDCRERLPEEARSRQYAAVVTQRGPDLDVRVTGATFGIGGDRFGGTVESGRAAFSLGEYNPHTGATPHLVEKLAAARFLGVDGTVVATGPADHLAGRLEGSLLSFDRDPGGDGQPPIPIAWCRSVTHMFVLSR